MSRVRTVVLALLGCVGILLATGAAAQAHVTVSSADAVAGGDAVVSVNVPTESDTLSTTAVALQLPTDAPIASVSVQPTPGWTATTKTSKLATPIKTDDGTVSEAVSEVDWTASSAASAIKPGQFQQFFLAVGPLPDTSSITFRALQTYSDGSVVRWIETPAPGSTSEPEHPAPVLRLTPISDQSVHLQRVQGSDGRATVALVLGIVGAVLGAAALGLTVLRRRVRT